MIKFNSYIRNKLVLSYEISKSCNLRCSYCYFLDSLDDSEKCNPEMANKVIQEIKKFKKENPSTEIELDLLGGDPLQAPILIDFIKELAQIDIVIWVVTNLTYRSESKIEKLKEIMELPNVGIAATWHDDIDDELFKRNMTILKKYKKNRNFNDKESINFMNLIASFVLFNGNKNMLMKSRWLIENGIDYAITQRYDDQERYLKYSEFDETTKEVYENSVVHRLRYFLNDEQISPEESEIHEYYNIANRNIVICEPLNFNIKYDGTIDISCKPKNPDKFQYHINDGIRTFRSFCEGGNCYCSYYGYKEIYGPKTSN